VFYEDTDAAGIVYYANYLKFAERARTELLRDFGISQRDMAAAGGPRFAVRHVEADFLIPARLDDELDVLTRVTVASGARVEMHQDIRRGTEDLARLKVRIACVNGRGRAVRLPTAVAGQLASISGMSRQEQSTGRV
jgi:acyl-CoA thioester hydrolase